MPWDGLDQTAPAGYATAYPGDNLVALADANAGVFLTAGTYPITEMLRPLTGKGIVGQRGPQGQRLATLDAQGRQIKVWGGGRGTDLLLKGVNVVNSYYATGQGSTLDTRWSPAANSRIVDVMLRDCELGVALGSGCQLTDSDISKCNWLLLTGSGPNIKILRNELHHEYRKPYGSGGVNPSNFDGNNGMMKVVFADGAEMAWNWVHDCVLEMIWFDVYNGQTSPVNIHHNLVERGGGPGIFFELSPGRANIYNNWVFNVGSHPVRHSSDYAFAAGIVLSLTSGGNVYENVIDGTPFGVTVKWRAPQPNEHGPGGFVDGHNVYNNQIRVVDDGQGGGALAPHQFCSGVPGPQNQNAAGTPGPGLGNAFYNNTYYTNLTYPHYYLGTSYGAASWAGKDAGSTWNAPGSGLTRPDPATVLAGGDTVVPPPPPPDIVIPYRINAGGPTINDTTPWSADDGTNPYVLAGGATVSNYQGTVTYDGTVPASTPQTVFHTERYAAAAGGNVAYTFPGLTAGTVYTVDLLFAENYTGITGTGQRVFDIYLNDVLVQDDFDIWAVTSGLNKATRLSFNRPADSAGEIRVSLRSVTQRAMLNGLRLNVTVAPFEGQVAATRTWTGTVTGARGTGVDEGVVEGDFGTLSGTVTGQAEMRAAISSNFGTVTGTVTGARVDSSGADLPDITERRNWITLSSDGRSSVEWPRST